MQASRVRVAPSFETGRTRRALLVSTLIVSVFGAGCSAETDERLYTAGEPGLATFTNHLSAPLFLGGCAPFHFERRANGTWLDIGPPFVCFWEGFAVPVGQNESIETPFDAPSQSGTYRLRYSVSAGCRPNLPASPANCMKSDIPAYTQSFEVERELCDPSERGCRFVPGAPNFLCADGEHVAGPSSECTRDPASGECGYEFLSCP